MRDSDDDKCTSDFTNLTPRRTVRSRNKPKKYDEYLDTSPVKRKINNQVVSSDEEINEESTPKSNALFGNGDVYGQDIFKFKISFIKNNLKNKVKSVVSNSVQTPRKSISVAQKSNEATPKCVLNILKKKIIQTVESESSDSDFSGESSDFVPDKSDEESETSASSSASDVEMENDQNKPSTVTKVTLTFPRSRNSKMKTKDSEYIVTPDNYFIMNSTKKITTSDRTLARLKNLNIDENRHDDDVHLSTEHRQRIRDLVHGYDHLFDRWLYALGEGFNVVLYGIGSKRAVLQRFRAQKLGDAPCVLVNGFFPGLTIKSVLETIVLDLLENTRVPANLGDVAGLIQSQLAESGADLFLLVHNIDGAMLRNSKAQAILATLAQLRNVHLVATIDHINAPLLWDHSKLSRTRLTWWDVTSFAPYAEEAGGAGGAACSRGGLQLAALRSVARSLTDNARGIFRLLAQHQLEHHKRPHYEGLQFKELYSRAREQFLASSAAALRAQLAEFLDHKLVRVRRSADGGEALLIPIDAPLLQQFLDQQTAHCSST